MTDSTAQRTYPEDWTAADVADKEIAHAVLPLLELADAFGTVVELVAERLLARFGNPETADTRISNFDAASCWEHAMGFAEFVQEMIEVDRPEAMQGKCRLRHVHGADHDAVQDAIHAGSYNDAPGDEPSTWVPAAGCHA